MQTIYPALQHPAGLAGRHVPFSHEMHFRSAMRYPPTVSLINVVVRAKSYANAMDDAAGIVRVLRELDPKLASPRARTSAGSTRQLRGNTACSS